MRQVTLGDFLSRIPVLASHISLVLKRTIDGVEIAIPIIRGQGLRHFWRFENETFATLKALIALSPGVFVDIGANIGQTLVKAKVIDRKLCYIGFEPSTASCAYVDSLIRINGFEECTLLPIGVSVRQAVLRLYYSHSTDASATIVAGFWTGRNRKAYSRSILVDRADTLIRRVSAKKVGVVKIDIEGGELEALAGLESIVSEDAPPIIIEVLPASCDIDPAHSDTLVGVKLRLERLKNLVDLLGSLRLSSHRLMPNGTLLETRDFDNTKYIPEQTNYLLLPTGSPLRIEKVAAAYMRHMAACL